MVFSKPGLGARKRRSGGGRQSVNRPNLTFAVSPKYLSNETKIHIFITRIPRGVYIIFLGFFKNFIFPASGRYLQTFALNDYIQVQKEEGKFVVVCPRPP